MAYNRFRMEDLQEKFGVTTDLKGDYFAKVSPVPISDTLIRHLDKYVSLATTIGTEKAKSELLVMPVVLEAKEQSPNPISLFSGAEFNPDPKAGLERGLRLFAQSLVATVHAVSYPSFLLTAVRSERVSL